MRSLLLPVAALAFFGLSLSSGEASAQEGAKTYATYCTTCHGADGKGDGPVAAGLDPKPANFNDAKFWEGKTDEYLTKVIKEGGVAVGKSPLMTAWGAALSDEKIAEVVKHLRTMQPTE